MQDAIIRPLWPGQPPTLSIIKPDQPTGGAVLVLPGGGYGHRAAHEGKPVARFLASHGILGAVCSYRHSPDRHPIPLNDAKRGLRMLRASAAEFSVDTTRVAVLGFSAGGHLAATLSNLFDDGDPNATDPLERVSSRPDASILCYPVITLESPFAHVGSRNNLLGENATPEMIRSMSMQTRVTERTPPSFIWHTADDAAVPVENALMYATALRAAKVDFELHVFPNGRHGLGLAADTPGVNAWPGLMIEFLHRRGW